MKALKETGNPAAVKMAGLEKYLADNNMSIERTHLGLAVHIDGREYVIKDVEMGEYSEELPRRLSSERLVIEE